MKAAIIVSIIGLGLGAQARGANLTTVDGTTYYNITSQRTDPDGLVIEYTPSGGGVGVSKVKFSRLSAEQQRQFGYDAARAKDYEEQSVKAAQEFRQESIRQEQAAQAQRAQQDARSDQEEKALNERIIALAQLKEAEADLARARGSDNVGYGEWSSLGGAVGVVAIPQVGGRVPKARFDPAPIVPAVPFPKVNAPHNDFHRANPAPHGSSSQVQR